MPVIVARRELMVALGAAAAWPLAAAFALAPAVSCPALAQGWPARSVRIVVPYAPGGGVYRHGRPPPLLPSRRCTYVRALLVIRPAPLPCED